MHINAAQIPPPKNWEQFEDLCHSLFKSVWDDPCAEKYGRRGQAQQGVDIFGSTKNPRAVFRGVQCKGKNQNYGAEVTEAELVSEIAKADQFAPPLEHWILATTAPTDARLQAAARQISADRAAMYKFTVQVLGWEDLQALIADHAEVVKRYYPALAYDLPALAEALQTTLSQQTTNSAGAAFSIALIDQEIEAQLTMLRQARFFPGFNREEYAEHFVARVESGALSGGSTNTRALALAWCARLLALCEPNTIAQNALTLSKSLALTDEAVVADAFLVSAKSTQATALTKLSGMSSSVASTAAFFIVANKSGVPAALNWVRTAQLALSDFDSDGKFLLICYCLVQGEWDQALEHAENIDDIDRETSPALLFIAAVAHLCMAVTAELRSIILDSPPFELDTFPLFSDPESLARRRTAKQLFERFAVAARALEQTRSEQIADDFVIWLMLRDPLEKPAGLKRVEESLRDANSSLRRLNFAQQFGVAFDRQAVEREIERRIALSGSASPDVAQARFVLVLSNKDARMAADYIGEHRAEMYEHLETEVVALVETQVLVHAGLVQRAMEQLAEFSTDDLDADARNRAQRIIDEAGDVDPIASREAQFNRSDALRDLVALVSAMEQKDDWAGLCEFGAVLFERTLELGDGERLVCALNEEARFAEIIELCERHAATLDQSRDIQIARCWALFNEGDLKQAAQRLTGLRQMTDHPDIRALRVNLAMSSGQWDSLIEFVSDEWSQRSKREPSELLRAAQLALLVESPRAKQLVKAAVERGADDPTILAGAYFLASNAGWEDDPLVASWLARAADLSDETGPLQRISVQELVERKPDWDRREADTWNSLNAGDVPIFAAARQLRRSVIDLSVLPALANLNENDTRRRAQVLTFSGARAPFPPNRIDSIAIDPLAIYTLSVLGELKTVIDTFDRVVIAHSTLSWLIQEMEKARCHQPSRIEQAHRIRDLVARKHLKVLRATAAVDRGLESEVGEGLATLIAAARDTSDHAHAEGMVVRSAPVHRLGSLMAEEADLTNYQACICSCGAVVTKLVGKGLISADEEQHARDYLTLRERDWPNQPIIEDDAHLFLDGLSIEYLDHLGLLDKLAPANLSAFVLAEEEQEATALIEYDRRSSDVINVIEDVRGQLAAGIASGKVEVYRAEKVADDPQDLKSNPTFSILTAATSVDGLVVDDRFINQHAHFSTDEHTTPVLTSLDVLDQLRVRKTLSEDAWHAKRISLRRAGYAFIPLMSDELDRHLLASTVVDDKLVETTELRAIRESVLRAQMTTTLQLPREATWLASVNRTLVDAVKTAWDRDEDIANIRARAAWLVNLADIRGWAHVLRQNGPKADIMEAYGMQLMQLFTASVSSGEDKTEAYLEWIDEFIVRGVAETSPELFDWIVERVLELVSESADTVLSTDAEDGIPAQHLRAARARAMTELFPKSIRVALIERPQFRREFGLTADSEFSYGSAERTFRRSALFSAMKAALAGETEESVRVDDVHGKTWHVEVDLEKAVPGMMLHQDDQRIGIPSFALLAADNTIRKRALQHQVSAVNLPPAVVAEWQRKSSSELLDDDAVVAFYDDLNNTPIRVDEAIRGELENGSCRLSTLVPQSSDYFARLIGAYDGEESLSDFAAGGACEHLQRLGQSDSVDGYRWGLLLSSHSSLCAEMPIDNIEAASLDSVLNGLIENSDLYSLLGGIESALRLSATSVDITATLRRLAQRLNETFFDEQSDRYRLLSALIMLVDGELARTRALAAYPPFYRRAATIAQASLIERAIIDADANDDSFREWAMAHRGQPFALQTLVDARLEPRWPPNFAEWQQLRNEFVGRLLNASVVHQTAFAGLELEEFVGSGPDSLRTRFEPALTSLPGPLEGAPHCNNIMPDELVELVDRHISATVVTPKSFIPLVNASLLFDMDDSWADTAMRALQRVEGRLVGVRDQHQLEAVLQGLATLAATARHSGLADELSALIRRYVGSGRTELPIDSAFRIAVTASACSADLESWCERVGHDLTLLAYEDQTLDDSHSLVSNIDWLCHIQPMLWSHCSRALAALRSIIGN